MCVRLHVTRAVGHLRSSATYRNTCPFTPETDHTNVPSARAASQTSRRCDVTARPSTNVTHATAARRAANDFCTCPRQGHTGCSTTELNHIDVISAVKRSLTGLAGCVIAAYTGTRAMEWWRRWSGKGTTVRKLYWSRGSILSTSLNSCVTNTEGPKTRTGDLKPHAGVALQYQNYLWLDKHNVSRFQWCWSLLKYGTFWESVPHSTATEEQAGDEWLMYLRREGTVNGSGRKLALYLQCGYHDAQHAYFVA